MAGLDPAIPIGEAQPFRSRSPGHPKSSPGQAPDDATGEGAPKRCPLRAAVSIPSPTRYPGMSAPQLRPAPQPRLGFCCKFIPEDGDTEALRRMNAVTV